MRTLLLSGGKDSSLIAAHHRSRIDNALIFFYHQPHSVEVARAIGVAERYGLPWDLVLLPEMTLDPENPVVPHRNLIFLTHAAARGATDIFLGANKADQELFEDCREEYLDRVADLLGVSIITPLMHMDKEYIKRSCTDEGLDGLTWSCYSPQGYGEACGNCGACRAEVCE